MAVLRRIPEEVSRLSFLISSARANTYAPTGTYECTYALCMHVVCLCVRALVLIAPRYPVRSSVNARRRRYYFAIERAHGGLIKSHESGYLPGPMHKLPPKTRPNLLPSLSCTREGEGDRTRGIYGRVPPGDFSIAGYEWFARSQIDANYYTWRIFVYRVSEGFPSSSFARQVFSLSLLPPIRN